MILIKLDFGWRTIITFCDSKLYFWRRSNPEPPLEQIAANGRYELGLPDAARCRNVSYRSTVKNGLFWNNLQISQSCTPKPSQRYSYDLGIDVMVRFFTGTPTMRPSLRTKVITVCNEKIAKKGETVGLSFYAFFANKNDDPELLMEAAEWWIKTHELDHFEKALKIRDMISSGA